MHKQHIVGAVKEAQGQMKMAFGRVLKNRLMQSTGRLDVAEGKARKVVGDRSDLLG
jgi:uncharacterized protein YjbJ (UPF0337 family)